MNDYYPLIPVFQDMVSQAEKDVATSIGNIQEAVAKRDFLLASSHSQTLSISLDRIAIYQSLVEWARDLASRD